MADNKQKRLRIGLTTTQTQPGNNVEPMTALEERVVRMLHGLTEEDDFELPFAQSSDPEVNARLMAMEAILAAEVHGTGPLSEESGSSARDRILNRLREIEDK